MASVSHLPRWLGSTLWPCLLLLPATAPTARASDDLVPAAVDALLAAPEDPIFFGIPNLLPAEPLAIVEDRGQGRCLVTLGDINEDGAADFAVGYAPGTASASLMARDGRSGAPLWSAVPPLSGFRSLRGLAQNGGTLVLGMTSPGGRVEALDARTGRRRWARDLATSPGSGPVNVSAVAFSGDLDGDGSAEVLVAGGAGIDGATLLSGRDGSTVWSHATGDVVYDARATVDLDGDGVPEVILVGGDNSPFATMVSGATGVLLWTVPLDGPGTVVLPIGDIDGDGTNDLAVGQFNAPGPCLLGLSGVDGTRLWVSTSIVHDVTDLTRIGDLLATGFADIAVGSFDNAVTAVLALNGNSEWRREGSTNNGGAMLSVATTDDLDGNGQLDVLTCSVDHRFYLMGGVGGQWMAAYDMGVKAVAVLALPDGNGDGRSETVVAADDRLGLLDGAAGLAAGPVVELQQAPPGQQGSVILWAYPATLLWGLVSSGTGTLIIPGWDQPFGLDVSRTVVLHQGKAPGAGATPLPIPSFDPSLSGMLLYIQAATRLGPAQGLFSDVAVLTIRS